jgi:hypothetical protein
MDTVFDSTLPLINLRGNENSDFLGPRYRFHCLAVIHSGLFLLSINTKYISIIYMSYTFT